MNSGGILNITEEYDEDDSIKSYQDYAYSPITGTQLNSSGEIRITIESQDEFFHPHGSYLQFKGRLVKNVVENTAYEDGNVVTLVNNAIMYLFSTIKYELDGQEIECINYPGPATSIQGVLKYTEGFSSSQGLNMCWKKDKGAGIASLTANNGFKERHSYIITSPAPKGSFSFNIPLQHIFGFCEDYNKIVYGMKHMLTLVRTGDNNAIFRLNSVGAGKILLDSITWLMPRVCPSDKERFYLYKTIEDKPSLHVGFRMRQCDTVTVTQSTHFTWRLSVRSAPERPRFVIIALQTNRDGDQLKNPAIFDHCNVKNMHVVLNSDRYPVDDYNASFTQQNVSRFYKDAADFISKFSGMYNAQFNIDPQEYTNLYPIFVFDVSKQSERLKTGIVDVTVKMEFSATVPANTKAYAIVICDRTIRFKGDGSRMRVII